jgi:hypothetical protein
MAPGEAEHRDPLSPASAHAAESAAGIPRVHHLSHPYARARGADRCCFAGSGRRRAPARSYGVAVRDTPIATARLWREGTGEAYYRPGADFISLPRFENFKSAATFYATAFHELGHATGHKSRLDRDLRHRFGERAYAAEELVAELCAAFLCAEFSVDGDLRHAGYIQSWIGLLKADSRAFFTALLVYLLLVTPA